jgi:thioredoxin-related protein
MFQTIVRTFLIVLTLQLMLHAKTINIDAPIDTAKKNDKHLFVWLHKTDCGYCENMREFTLENERVSAFIKKHFIFVHINVYEKETIQYQDFSGDSKAFAQEIGYDFYPTSLFFDEDKEVVFAEVGYVDSDKNPNEKHIYKVLNFIQSKSYKTMEFEDYKYDVKGEF